MEFQISGRHLEITPAIHDYAKQKTEKLHRYYDRIQEISVIAQKADGGLEIELIVDVEHHDPVIAKHHGEDLYACIDQSVDKAERQLTDLKERLRNHKHPDTASSS